MSLNGYKGVIIMMINDIGPCYFLNCRLKLKKLNTSPPNLKLGIYESHFMAKPKIKVFDYPPNSANRSTVVIYTYTALSAVTALRLVLLFQGFLPENHLLKIMRS